MNKDNFSLKKILKGLEGIELYSSKGKITLIDINDDSIYPIEAVLKSDKIYYLFDDKGKSDDGSLTLFPSKNNTDWNSFDYSFLKNKPMMCSNDGLHWCLRKYNKKLDDTHYVYDTDSFLSIELYKYIVIYEKFDPYNIKNNLKYNIQNF